MRSNRRRREALQRVEAARADLARSVWARDEVLQELAETRAAAEQRRRTVEVLDHGHPRTISAVPFEVLLEVDEVYQVAGMAEAGVRIAQRELDDALEALRTSDGGGPGRAGSVAGEGLVRCARNGDREGSGRSGDRPG